MIDLISKTGRSIMLAADTMATLLPSADRPAVPDGRKRLLVVRMDAMGDLVLFTNGLRGLRELYPAQSWELTLAVNSLWAGLLEGQGVADHVLAVDRTRFLSSLPYRYSVARQVRSRRFDLALNPVASRVAMLGDALVRCSAATERIGWEAAEDNISAAGRMISDRWYTQRFPAQKPQLMELERNAIFVRHLGHEQFRADLPELAVLPRWLREARPVLEKAGVGERFMMLVPGTGPPAERKWPTSRWASLAERVVNETAFEVVLCGGEDEGPVAREVMQRCGQAVSDLTGKTTIEQLAGVIAQAMVVVGSDTGPVHLACALGAPSVCILGGAFPKRFFPYSVLGPGPVPRVVTSGECTCERWNCSRWSETSDTFPCIEDVQVDSVFREVVRAVGSDAPG
jgi:ADP-heptose:LPS heptosyltransferase